MCKEIKTTPILRGKDARRFWKRMEENTGKKADPKELERIRKNYEKLKAISNF